MEVAQGVSIDKIRERLLGGNKSKESDGNGKAKSENGSSSQPKLVRQNSVARISRREWSTDDLFNRFTTGAKADPATPRPPRELTPLQKAAQKLEAAEGSEVILKKFFRAGNESLLVSSNLIASSGSVFEGLA